MAIKERIKEYCEVKNIAVFRFEHNTGISNGYFNNIKKRFLKKRFFMLESVL